jgi:hypothetical protein
VKHFPGLAAAVLLLAGCTGPAAEQKRSVSQLQSEGDFAAAADRILASRDEYGPANAALYDLDLAQALADAGRRTEADGHFASGQDRLEKLWTLSVTKRASAAIANENVDDWRGEDFERALAFVLRALNFVALGRGDAALIEAKRLEAYLDDRSRSEPRPRTYRDDAFAHWLAARLYEDLGKDDDARVSQTDSDRAYKDYERSYGVAPPPPPAGEGAAEIAVVLLEGPAPRKVRRTGDGPLGLLLQSSYPAFETAPSSAASCSAAAGATTATLATAEDVSAIAAKDLEERLTTIKTRSTLRAAAKLAGTAFGVNAVDSEFADVRSWSTLPARLRVARLRTAPGDSEVRVRCLDATGVPVLDRTIHARPAEGRRAWLVLRAP